MKLDAMTHVHTVLSHGWFLWVIKPDVSMLLFDPGLNGEPHFTNEDLLTFIGDTLYARGFQAKGILDWLKETANLLRQENTDLILCLESTLPVQSKVDPTKSKKSTSIRSSLSGGLRVSRICHCSHFQFCPGRLS
jgi:hypothetical protein